MGQHIIPPVWDFSQSEPYQFSYSIAGKPNLAVGIYPSQSPMVTALLMGFPQLRSDCELTLLLGFSPSEVQLCSRDFPQWRIKICRYLCRTIPTREHHKPTKLFTGQVTYPGVKDKHSEEARTIPNNTNGK